LVYISAGELSYEASVKNGVSSLASNSWPKSFYLELIPGITFLSYLYWKNNKMLFVTILFLIFDFAKKNFIKNTKNHKIHVIQQIKNS
jgi:hypothetical protein